MDGSSENIVRSKPPLTIARNDDLLSPDAHRLVREFLDKPGWSFGWKSKGKEDVYSFWHKHFAGFNHNDQREPDDDTGDSTMSSADRLDGLRRNGLPLYAMWQGLQASLLQGHELVQCYANAFSFGCEGTLHTDSRHLDQYTCIYYPSETWQPDWGGETVFFNPEQTDIVSAIYPRPNRLVMFNAVIPHVARGLSRTCPVMRTTLMFKTRKVA